MNVYDSFHRLAACNMYWNLVEEQRDCHGRTKVTAQSAKPRVNTTPLDLAVCWVSVCTTNPFRTKVNFYALLHGHLLTIMAHAPAVKYPRIQPLLSSLKEVLKAGHGLWIAQLLRSSNGRRFFRPTGISKKWTNDCGTGAFQ